MPDENSSNDLIEKIDIAAWKKDIDLKYTWVNAAWVELFGIQIDWIGKKDSDVFNLLTAKQLEESDFRAIAKGKKSEDALIITKVGAELLLRIHRVTNHDADGIFCGLSGMAIDKTHNRILIKQLEDILLDMNIQRDALHQNALITITDYGGNYLYASEKYCELIGYTRLELIKINRFDICNNDKVEFEELLGSLFYFPSILYDIHAKTKNNEDLWLQSLLVAMPSSHGEQATYYEIYTDITSIKQREETLEKQIKLRTTEIEKTSDDLKIRNIELIDQNEKIKKMQYQLLQSDKMASIGQLSAGIAHEINNPIGYVNSNLSSLESHVADLIELVDTFSESYPQALQVGETVAKCIEKIDYDYLKEDLICLMNESKEGISRVKSIVQNLKDFSRLDETHDWCYADIQSGINSTLNIVNNEIKYKAEVVKKYGDIPEIECMPSQLNQVFLNILVNAGHAIENKGYIYITTEQHNDEVCISFTDTGSGIPEDVINRIFDPFFTTKPVGKGTGLGLSLSYGVVKKHSGRFIVTSTVGEGTTFEIWLPIKQGKTNQDANE